MTRLKQQTYSMILLLALTIVFALMVNTVHAVQAKATPYIIEQDVSSVTVKNDKNGNEYVRFILEADATANGIAYKKQTVAMVFGSTVDSAKSVEQGGKLKALIQESVYQGNITYRILKVLE